AAGAPDGLVGRRPGSADPGDAGGLRGAGQGARRLRGGAHGSARQGPRGAQPDGGPTRGAGDLRAGEIGPSSPLPSSPVPSPLPHGEKREKAKSGSKTVFSPSPGGGGGRGGERGRGEGLPHSGIVVVYNAREDEEGARDARHIGKHQ